MKRSIAILALLIGAMGATPAHACPMCKYANENNQQSEAEMARPRAYMYSILFMIAMPMTLVTGYGLAFYRLSKKQREMMSIEPLDDGPEIL